MTAGMGAVTNVTEIREISGKNLDLDLDSDLEVLPPSNIAKPSSAKTPALLKRLTFHALGPDTSRP